MKVLRILAAATLIAGSSLAFSLADAQQPAIKRTELLRNDLSVPGRETVQMRVEFEPGAALGFHTHPGEEITYVLEGSSEYEIKGKPPIMLNAGDSLFIPAGTIHAARNAGSVKSSALATYVVEKGKPLVVME